MLITRTPLDSGLTILDQLQHAQCFAIKEGIAPNIAYLGPVKHAEFIALICNSFPKVTNETSDVVVYNGLVVFPGPLPGITIQARIDP